MQKRCLKLKLQKNLLGAKYTGQLEKHPGLIIEQCSFIVAIIPIATISTITFSSNLQEELDPSVKHFFFQHNIFSNSISKRYRDPF